MKRERKIKQDFKIQKDVILTNQNINGIREEYFDLESSVS